MIFNFPNIWCRALLAVATSLTLTGCPQGAGGDCSKVPTEVCTNCKTNLDMASAQLKACAAGGEENCNGLVKDLDQLGTVNPANKQSADEAKTHVAACKGQGEGGVECGQVSSALAKLKCEG